MVCSGDMGAVALACYTRRPINCVGYVIDIGGSEPILGQLFFRCPTLGREFDGGFQIDAKDLKQVPPSFPIRLRCKVCMEFHEFKFATGRISEKH